MPKTSAKMAGSRTDRAKKRKHVRTSKPIKGKDFPPAAEDKSWHPAFLEALKLVPNIKRACEKASVGRATVYEHRDRHPDFAAAWDSAWSDGLDGLRSEIQNRYLKSDRILELGARLWLPEYKDKLEISGPGGGAVPFTFQLDKANRDDGD